MHGHGAIQSLRRTSTSPRSSGCCRRTPGRRLAARSISGLPELPPMMSLLVERLNRVLRSSLPFASSQLSGSLNGSHRWRARRGAPSRVKGGDVLAVLLPALHGAVIESQREGRVWVDARASAAKRAFAIFSDATHGRLRLRPRSSCAPHVRAHRSPSRARSSDRPRRRSLPGLLSTAPCGRPDPRASCP